MVNHGFIHDLIARFAAASHETIAFSLYDGEQIRNISYPAFVNDLLKAANYFVSRSITSKHIAIAAPNSYDWIVTFFAITASGNAAVLLNQDLSAEALGTYCETADVSMICSDRETMAEMKNGFSGCTLLSFDDIKADEPLPLECVHAFAPDETVAMIFTSGTTGKTKIVELTSENFKCCLANSVPGFTTPHMERLYTPIPFFHIAGLHNILASLEQHQTECLGRSIKYLFGDLSALNPTALNIVPSIVDSLIKIFQKTTSIEKRARFVGSQLKLIRVGGAALSTASSQLLRNAGMEVSVFYGMSETTGVTAWMMVDDEHKGSTGKFCRYTEYRIEDGELLLRGPFMMKGYYKNPEETQNIIKDGWIYTGDLARVDEDGYLYIVGRKKNIIILANGKNVNPEELEEALRSSPHILECMVYGDGKGICADINTENQEAAAAFVREYNAKTPMYRQVYKVNYQDQPLQKTASGKIKRKENVYA